MSFEKGQTRIGRGDSGRWRLCRRLRGRIGKEHARIGKGHGGCADGWRKGLGRGRRKVGGKDERMVQAQESEEKVERLGRTE
jgi:hypothetical protein